MSRCLILRQERERFQQSDVGRAVSLEEIAKSVFLGVKDPVDKLARVEAGQQAATREETRRLLRLYKTNPETASEVLNSYAIADELAALVAPSGRSRDAIAAAAGISYHHLIRILNGRRLVKSEEQLVTIAEALRASEEDIVGLLQKAHINDSDPLWYQDLARREKEDRECDIDLVYELREQLRKLVGVRRWQKVDSHLNAQDLGSAAIGPHEISSLATSVVKDQHYANDVAAGKLGALKISLGERFVGNEKLLEGFFAATVEVLESNGDVQVLLPRADGVKRVFQTIKTALSFLGKSGTLDVRYADERSSPSEPLRLVISRGGRVLQLFPRERRYADDTAVIVPDTQGVFRRHFDQRFAAGQSLLRLFRSDTARASSLQKALREAETEPGTRLYLRRRLAPTVIPTTYWHWERRQILEPTGQFGLSEESWDPWRFERLALAHAKNARQRDALLDELRDEKVARYKRHIENLAWNPTREIFSKASFVQFLDSLGDAPELRTAIISQFLDWLNRFDDYALALVDDEQVLKGALFGLHGGENIFLSVPRKGKLADYLQVRHRHTRTAFQTYYMSVWNSLPEHNTNKTAVAEQLRALQPRRSGARRTAHG